MKNFTKTRIGILALSLAILFSACKPLENANNTQKGAGLGAITGAALGAILGGKDNRALGAIIGAAVGGAAGGVIGKKMDKQAEDIQTTLPGAEVKRVGEGIQVILDEKSGDGVKFALNSADLTVKSKETLGKLMKVFNTYPDTNILVVGHTDSSGADDYNMRLSIKRAQSVVDYLISNGISASRISSEGKGETEPKFANDTEENRARNRRVEFAITANEKMKQEAESQTP